MKKQSISRRRFMAAVAAVGVASTGLPEVLWAAVDAKGKLTLADLAHAEKLLGVEMTDEERQLLLSGVEELRDSYQRLREVPLGNEVVPALSFSPLGPGIEEAPEPPRSRHSPPRQLERPRDEAALALLPLTDLAELLRQRLVSARELTELYIRRIQRFDGQLHSVITLMADQARAAADRADADIAAGRYRGPLHGIPWGAKDLLATRNAPTTWGAKPFKDQTIEMDATVVTRLQQAGAILLAKLSLGALAWGDVWFGETTRNPWNLEQGSSGSSAGPAAATAAGLVGFSIGSETWGSIVSPSTRCGVSGLRPTFGRVSRHGAMALSWSMDKLGPMCRSIEDCALVMEAIAGPDGQDPMVLDRPFRWDASQDLSGLRVGVLESGFNRSVDDDAGREQLALEQAARARIEGLLGRKLIPIQLPELPTDALSFILSAEAAAAFDALTRSGRDDEMVRQIENAWPNVFRQARHIPAVEYIQANRVRTLLMQQMDRQLASVDLYLTTSFGPQLLLNNLTGHPCAVMPAGFRQDGTPVSISLVGRLCGENSLIAVAKAYQQATDYHLSHPGAFMS